LIFDLVVSILRQVRFG